MICFFSRGNSWSRRSGFIRLDVGQSIAAIHKGGLHNREHAFDGNARAGGELRVNSDLMDAVPER
jgi:hypothetical protein